MDTTKEKLNIEHHACPNCGAEAVFDPKTQMLVCPYCNTQTEVAENQTTTYERNIDILFSESKVWTDAETIQCENCGAKETISKGQIATHCPFCGTTNIVKTTDIVGMTPHGVCPFVYNVDDAAKFAKAWARKKAFAPNKFKKSAEPKSISGLYSPAFTFDCSTNTHYKGVLGKTHTRMVRGSDGKMHSEHYTVYFDISGNHSAIHDDVLIHATGNIPNVMLEGLGKYPTESAATYSEKYLAGYPASSYSKDGNQAWSEGKLKIDNTIKQQILKNYTYDKVSSFKADTKYNNRSFKYLLLPVFVGHHKYKQKLYNFYVNGSTGKVSGKAPVSWIKVLLAILGGAALIGAIIALALLGNK